MEKSEEEMQEIEIETKPLLEEVVQDENRKNTSLLDKIIIGLSFAAGFDSILFPFFMDTTIHEYFGFLPKNNYEIYSGITSLVAEQGMFFLSMFYNTARAFYKREKN